MDFQTFETAVDSRRSVNSTSSDECTENQDCLDEEWVVKIAVEAF